MTRFDWDDLKYLLAVSRASTVSQASRTLAVDHATVIRRLDSLEQALGTKLFQRNSRGYDLTHTGEKLLASAQMIEAETVRAIEDIGASDPSISGTVRISALEGIGNFFLAQRLPQFAIEHPDLSIELIAIQQLVALARRDADLAITLRPPPNQDRFVNEHLADYHLYVYASQEYLDRAPAITSRDDLQKHPFAAYIGDLIFMKDLDYLEEIGYRRRPRLQSSSLIGQMEAALAGYGLCVLPRFIAIRHKELVPVLPREIFLRRSYWLVSHTETVSTARVRAVRRFIQREALSARELFLGGDDLTEKSRAPDNDMEPLGRPLLPLNA
jgi:DNA-binding transcriptional LysR family regulator